MIDINVKGIAKEDEDYEWHLEAGKERYSADILCGIDDILGQFGEDILEDGDEVKLIIRVKRCEK